MMKQVSEMPTSGQFVAVWQVNSEPHGYKMLWEDEYLYEVNESTEELYEVFDVDSLIKYHKESNTLYFIAD